MSLSIYHAFIGDSNQTSINHANHKRIKGTHIFVFDSCQIFLNLIAQNIWLMLIREGFIKVWTSPYFVLTHPTPKYWLKTWVFKLIGNFFDLFHLENFFTSVIYELKCMLLGHGVAVRVERELKDFFFGATSYFKGWL